MVSVPEWKEKVSILILLDYLFLCSKEYHVIIQGFGRLNPYFIGLSILIFCSKGVCSSFNGGCLNPYFIGLSILITSPLRSYLVSECLNPYFIGLSILILQMRE